MCTCDHMPHITKPERGIYILLLDLRHMWLSIKSKKYTKALSDQQCME